MKVFSLIIISILICSCSMFMEQEPTPFIKGEEVTPPSGLIQCRKEGRCREDI